MRLSLLAFGLITLAGCGGGGGSDTTPTIPVTPSTPSNPIATTSVTMQNNLFNPENIVVVPGATITFTNSDGISHNAIFESTAITSTGDFASGSRTVKMPTAVGTYRYTCTIHSGMSGTVKVQ